MAILPVLQGLDDAHSFYEIWPHYVVLHWTVDTSTSCQRFAYLGYLCPFVKCRGVADIEKKVTRT